MLRSPGAELLAGCRFKVRRRVPEWSSWPTRCPPMPRDAKKPWATTASCSSRSGTRRNRARSKPESESARGSESPGDAARTTPWGPGEARSPGAPITSGPRGSCAERCSRRQCPAGNAPGPASGPAKAGLFRGLPMGRRCRDRRPWVRRRYGGSRDASRFRTRTQDPRARVPDAGSVTRCRSKGPGTRRSRARRGLPEGDRSSHFQKGPELPPVLGRCRGHCMGANTTSCVPHPGASSSAWAGPKPRLNASTWA
eukprot:15445576-Alexandrium_andersonii.AAC.7